MIPRLILLTLWTLCLFAPVLHAQTNQELLERIEALEAEREASADAEDSYFTKLGSMFELYGFLRVDATYSDSEFNDTQVSFRVLPENGSNDDDDDFSLYGRLTRLGLNFTAPEGFLDASLTGRFEIDFYAFDSSDSRNLIRMRHAYLQLADDDWSFLAGQTSDLISPLYPSVNPDLVNWNVGNLGDRRPQLRGTYAPAFGDAKLTFAGALALQGAIDGKNFDAPDGVTNGEDSGLPQIQARAAVGVPLFGEQHTELGVWGARGWEETDGTDPDEWDMKVFGLDLRVPIVEDRLWVQGEVWQGENVSDVRGGVGQGINTTTLDEIDATGGWIQGTTAVDGLGDVFAGYTVDSPDREDVPVGTGVTRNSALYAGMTVKRWDPFIMGFEWMGWETEYRGNDDGDANRFRLYFSYKF